jgi:hypothetical protein
MTKVPLQQRFGVGFASVHRTRQRLVEEGLAHALTGHSDGGPRQNVAPHRTKQNSAVQMHELVDGHCPEATVSRLVVDTFTTHTPATWYETCTPTEARRITRKLAWHDAPICWVWSQFQCVLYVCCR